MSGIGNGIAEALGFQSLARDVGWELSLTVHSDATAAIGIARRRGMGKVRHLDVTDLWIHEKSDRNHSFSKSSQAITTRKHVDQICR